MVWGGLGLVLIIFVSCAGAQVQGVAADVAQLPSGGASLAHVRSNEPIMRDEALRYVENETMRARSAGLQY